MPLDRLLNVPAAYFCRPANQSKVRQRAGVAGKDMFETMYDDGGVGLAAQPDWSCRCGFVCDGLRRRQLVAANPESFPWPWNKAAKMLSLIGKSARRGQASRVAVIAGAATLGKHFEREASRLAARCVLHETDSLRRQPVYSVTSSPSACVISLRANSAS